MTGIWLTQEELRAIVTAVRQRAERLHGMADEMSPHTRQRYRDEGNRYTRLGRALEKKVSG